MAFVKPLERIVSKWTTVTPMRADEYRYGVEHPRRDWDKAAIEANDRYVKAVTAAAQAGRYKGGIERVGIKKWKEMATAKGPGRFTEGVYLSGDLYKEGFAPFHKVIMETELPPKGPVGDPGNIQRVAAISQALHKKRLELRGIK